MDFIAGLSISINWKSKSYNSILVIINCQTKIVYYLSAKVVIDASDLAKVIINMIIHHYTVPELIVID